jgi:hypothetical protein
MRFVQDTGQNQLHTRAVWNVYNHCEYLENWLHSLDVAWQPVRGDQHCASMNSHSPMGLVSWHWDTVDWACVICDCCIHSDWVSRSASSWHCPCPFYSSCAGFFGEASHHPGLSAPILSRFGSLWLPAFPTAKITIEREEIVNAMVTVRKHSQWCLTANWLAPRESDCSWMHSKISSGCLPGYIKVTWPVLKIVSMVR